MAETKERRKTPRKATPKPDRQGKAKAAAPRKPTSHQRAAAPMTTHVRSEASAEEIRKLIEEAAYYRAKQRNFEPGHELEDWIQAESEVMVRIGVR
jgi:hypothetical protein